MQNQTAPLKNAPQKTPSSTATLGATVSAVAVAVVAAVYLFSHMTVLALDDSSSQTDIVTLVVPAVNAVLASLGGVLLIVGALFGRPTADHKI